jgi:ATP phosphoribosyltransferase regulatory subunit
MTITTAPDLHMYAAEPGRSQIPTGVQDRFLIEAVRLREAEASLRSCFSRWGYQEVIPPTFEYCDNLLVGASSRLQQALYRFFDRKGRTLALRADFTPQVARMAATKLYDQPMPLRCFYLGSVFRYEEPQAGRMREFTQAGVELVGAETAAADAEVVALAIAAMEELELEGFQINLGQMEFFRALTDDLSTTVLAPIREAIDHKNRARLAEALDRARVAGPRRELLSRLPDLIGGPEVCGEARALTERLPDGAGGCSALERLGQLYDLLQAYGVGDRVIVDLGEVRGMDYYSGITFRGVTPSLGWPVISGGRYDNLIAQFGRPLPAVGFGFGIERALLVQARKAQRPPVPHLLVHGCGHPACLALVQRLRQQGCRVEVDLFGLDEASLAEQAHLRAVPRTLNCSGARWLLSDAGGRRVVTEATLLGEAATWDRLPAGEGPRAERGR